MLETSADLLKVVLAASVGLFTLFLCWGMFYIIMSARNIMAITKEARSLFQKVDDVLEAIKDKIHSSASYLVVIGEAVKRILGFMKDNEGKIRFPKFGKKKDKKKSKKEQEEKEEEEDDVW
ncbi:hypothetical protein GF382_01805 [Candidatus Falkowbacteria bacterium]|nr:hypothetical protein [Candidatus Falkowbacteria bacterium]